MNLKEKQQKLRAIDAEIQELSAKEGKTQDELKRWDKLLQQSDALATEIDLDERTAKHTERSRAEVGGSNVAAIETKMTFESRPVGQDLVAFDAKGLPFLMDAQGFGISDAQFRAISQPSYKKAYIRAILGKADRHDFEAVLSEGVDTEGGYLVPPDMQAEIIRRSPQAGGVYDLVRQVPTLSDKLRYPKLDYTTDDIHSSPVRIKWTGETTDAENAGEPKWGQAEIDIHEGMVEIPLTRSLVEDRGDADQIIAEELGVAYRLGMCDVILNGNGVSKPHGILENPGQANEPPTVNLGNPVTADNLLKLVYGLPPQYQANARLLIEQTDVYTTLTTLKDTANNYIFGLWKNIDGGLATDRLETIRGKPITFDPFMPTSGSANKVAVYGDFNRGYYLGTRLGMSLRLQDLPRNALVYLVGRFRVGGDVVQPRALRVGVQS